MKHESDLVYLLEANGATEEDCKEADNKLKEIICRSGRYIEDDLYTNLLLLSLLKEKSRIIPRELGQKILSLRRLITTSVYSKGGEYKGSITLEGLSSLGRVYSKMKPTNQKEFDRNVSYLDSKMHNRS